jgi:D-inositol-3-phosphate glycosyltransferase
LVNRDKNRAGFRLTAGPRIDEKRRPIHMHLLNSRPCRIAVISAHTSPLARLGGHKAGGMNVYVRETAIELARLGHTVDVFTRDDGSHPEIVELAPGARVVHLSAGPRDAVDKDGVWQHLPAFLHSLRCFKERQGLQYDLVHSHYWLSGWVGSYLQRLWDVPHVTMFHTLGAVKNRARDAEHEPQHRIDAERRVVATADAVVAASAHEVDQIAELYGGDPARTAVIPCGVNLDLFGPLDRVKARQALGLNGAPVVLFVGRLEPLKGPDLLIDMLPHLDDGQTTLVIAGGDAQAADYKRDLRRRARELGVASRVRFVGAVQQDELPLYYSAADVCAIPSYYESFGLVALESMACGTPVVASKVGGLPGTVHDKVNGYLVPERTPQAFAERVGAVLADSARRRWMREAALATVERFRWSSVAAELDKLYDRLWATRAATGCHDIPAAAAIAVGEHDLCHIG